MNNLVSNKKGRRKYNTEKRRRGIILICDKHLTEPEIKSKALNIQSYNHSKCVSVG